MRTLLNTAIAVFIASLVALSGFQKYSAHEDAEMHSAIRHLDTTPHLKPIRWHVISPYTHERYRRFHVKDTPENRRKYRSHWTVPVDGEIKSAWWLY